MHYETFELRIQPGLHDAYEAVVTRSLAGDARAGFTLPFSQAELDARLGQILGASRHFGAAGAEAAGPSDLQGFGAQLYQAAFGGAVGACLVRSLDRARQAGAGLRIRLRIDDRLPALADLPWEYLYAPELGRFLALSADTPLLRYLEVPHAGVMRLAPPPLVVLAVLSNPTGVTPLAVEDEWARLQTAVASLSADQVRLERVAATWPALQARLRQGPAHVLHFIGHGYFDEEAQGGQGEGGLIFEDEAGQPVLTPAGRFKVLLQDKESLRLIFLNACEGARGGRSDSFAGVAQKLVQQALPAVLAMQFPVSDRAAIALSQEFYRALADGYPLEAAVSEARKAIYGPEGNPEWGTPVLFSRSDDNRLVELPQGDQQPVVDTIPFESETLSIPTQDQAAADTLWFRLRRAARVYRRFTWAGIGMVTLLIILLMLLEWPPFQRRFVWVADTGLDARRGVSLANSGTSLIVGAENWQEGCEIIPKGLWYRALPDGVWRESEVGNLLCIEDRDTAALANIPALGVSPDLPGRVYALTSHKGILVSTNGGATFQAHPAPYPDFQENNLPFILSVGTGPQPDLWVGTQGAGLWRVTEQRWESMDGRGEQGCQGLPSVTVRSLLASDARVLIGTDQQGLWLSEDHGQTCQRVLDDAGRFEITRIVELEAPTHQRYLVAMRNRQVDNLGNDSAWSLRDLCPRPESCAQRPWKWEPTPLWLGGTPIIDVFAQQDESGELAWFLVSERLGQVWTGSLQPGSSNKLGSINRCLPACDMQFAPDGHVPYLLAAEPGGRWAGRVYHYEQGAWWRQIWP